MRVWEALWKLLAASSWVVLTLGRVHQRLPRFRLRNDGCRVGRALLLA